MIEFRHVSKSYNKGAVKAVDDLDLVVRPGEIFGFLGPNRAGKTTTSFLLTAAGMIIDLAKPFLDWTNPQKAIKQNLNVLLATFADIAILAALGYFSRLLGKWGAGDGLILAILFGISILLSIASFHLLMEFARKRYAEIEV